MAPIPQSDTRWVKKPGKAGYVEQISTGKRVTGKVALSTTIGSGGKTIANRRSVADYSKGRNVTKTSKYSDKPKMNPPANNRNNKTVTSPKGATPNPRGADTVSSQSKIPVTRAGGAGLRGTASKRGAYGTGSGSTKRVGIAPKPTPAPTPKRPLTAAERAKQTGGVNAYGMMGGAEGTVRSGRNKSKDGVFAPGVKDKLFGGTKLQNLRNDFAIKEAERQKRNPGPAIGETKKVPAGVGYVQMQKYTKNGWVNVGPKRKSR